jgi:glucokinase
MLYLGIEIGGSKLQLGLGPGDGSLLQLCRDSVDASRGPEGIRTKIAVAVPRLLKDAGVATDQLKAVGIGFGGPVDDATRTIVKSHQIEGWDGFPLADWVSDIVKCPAALGNDSDVAALAEALFGAGKGISPVFYFNIGSGIGGGLILDGHIYRGCGRGAAEFGHLKVLDGETFVTLEDVASGWSIGRRARTLLAAGQGKDSLLSRMVTHDGAVTAAHVGRAAAANDRFSRSILEGACDAIGQALRHVVVLLCPRRIILGGGVSLMGGLLLDLLRQQLSQIDFVPFVGLTELVRASLGEEVVVHGALALARRAYPD